MPCCTYLDESRIAAARQWMYDHVDPEAIEFAAAFSAACGQDLLVMPYPGQPPRRRLFGLLSAKPAEQFVEVLVHVDGPEWQILNFPRPEASGWSINHVVTKRMAETLLMGIQIGIDTNRKSPAGKDAG